MMNKKLVKVYEDYRKKSNLKYFLTKVIIV